MIQGTLFDLPEVRQVHGHEKKYWIPQSDDVDTPLCWDCKHFRQDLNDLGPRKCKVSKLEVDYRGTCGSHVFRSKEVESQAMEYSRAYKKGRLTNG